MFTGSEHALTTTSCFDIDITLIDSMQNLEQLVFHFKSKSCESLFYSRGKKLTPLFALFSVAYRVFLTDSQFNSCLRIPTYCACPLPGVRCHSFSEHWAAVVEIIEHRRDVSETKTKHISSTWTEPEHALCTTDVRNGYDRKQKPLRYRCLQS